MRQISEFFGAFEHGIDAIKQLTHGHVGHPPIKVNKKQQRVERSSECLVSRLAYLPHQTAYRSTTRSNTYGTTTPLTWWRLASARAYSVAKGRCECDVDSHTHDDASFHSQPPIDRRTPHLGSPTGINATTPCVTCWCSTQRIGTSSSNR